MYQKILKEGNGKNKYLRCPDLQYNSFEVLRSAIAQDKTDLECEETVEAKNSGNDSGFITYLDIIDFYVKWLDYSGYLKSE